MNKKPKPENDKRKRRGEATGTPTAPSVEENAATTGGNIADVENSETENSENNEDVISPDGSPRPKEGSEPLF